MSTDWSKYSTPPETRIRARKPQHNGVIRLHVGAVRAVPQVVEHAPTAVNRAHTDVAGEKSTEVRAMLRRIAVWEIAAPSMAD